MTYTSQRSSTTTEELSNPESGHVSKIYDGSVFGWSDFCGWLGWVFRGGKIDDIRLSFFQPMTEIEVEQKQCYLTPHKRG